MADTLSLVDLSRLAAPFPPDAISWRVGSTNSEKTKGLALAYIDARDVMDRLDQVCGITGWQNEFIETPKGRIMCRIGIHTREGWVWKGDGAGETDVESEKGAISDALKRAAVHWGVGRYLYSLPATWVQIEQRGKSSIIKDSEYAKLRAIAARVPSGASPQSLSPAPDAAGDVTPVASRTSTKVVNPETGRMIDPNSAHQLRKGDTWKLFERTVRDFDDLNDLEAWWADAATVAEILKQPASWQQLATEEYEKAQERLAEKLKRELDAERERLLTKGAP